MKALGKAGYRVVRQRGSHIFLVKDENVVPVPRHSEIMRGTLLAIITEAGLSKEEFLNLI